MTNRQENTEASTQAWRERAEREAIKRDILALRAARRAKRMQPTITEMLRGPATRETGFLRSIFG